MWKDIVKINDKDKEMYLDATKLVDKIFKQSSVINDIQEFVNKYDEVKNEPIEWVTMHDYIMAVVPKLSEIATLSSNAMKVISKELREGMD